ncbi:unnamed protein product [Protopolystoma xenopodis]|uniref:SET domain-containing protein n=1 Tax=Protopolystoma xenopodis TaxID=117903 RepID=A0A448XCH0_9PLAT|nr:unnamed protein product [Protopolystoma xenopodis]
MVPGSDYVPRRTNKSSAQSHRGRKTVNRGLFRTIQQTKVEGNPPAISDEANLRIPSTRLLKRNKSFYNILRRPCKEAAAPRGAAAQKRERKREAHSFYRGPLPPISFDSLPIRFPNQHCPLVPVPGYHRLNTLPSHSRLLSLIFSTSPHTGQFTNLLVSEASGLFCRLALDLVVDAGVRGGLARFINHSCEPNLEAQTWFVSGQIRVGKRP